MNSNNFSSPEYVISNLESIFKILILTSNGELEKKVADKKEEVLFQVEQYRNLVDNPRKYSLEFRKIESTLKDIALDSILNNYHKN
jgi:hypothetical protein